MCVKHSNIHIHRIMRRFLVQLCEICTTAPTDITLPCGHQYCQECTIQWLAVGARCPKKCGKAGVRLAWAGSDVIEVDAAPEDGDNPFDELNTPGETVQGGGLVHYESGSDEELPDPDQGEGQVEVKEEAGSVPVEEELKESSSAPAWFHALTEAQQQQVSAFIRSVIMSCVQ
jgi:hypothetical protein